jgi:hypothetical protein
VNNVGGWDYVKKILKEKRLAGMCEVCGTKRYFDDDGCECTAMKNRKETKMKPHKHAEVIKAWADGHTIQWKDAFGDWNDIVYPRWDGMDFEFRIKPEPKPDVAKYFIFDTEDKTPVDVELVTFSSFCRNKVIEVVWDGETGELKSSEVLK